MVSVNPSQTWISAWISMNALKEAIIVQRKKVLSAGIIRVTTHASVQKDLKHITGYIVEVSNFFYTGCPNNKVF